jgi:ParB family chromosome partitioning protein
MAKLDRIREQYGAHAEESLGSRPAGIGIHGGSTASAVSRPGRRDGIVRSIDAARIPLDRIVPDPDQPRREFDQESLELLAESLRTRGQIAPITVRWDESRAVNVIVCGERRWRAARIAGLEMITCVMADEIDPADHLVLQMIEKACREDLRPIEQARAYRALIDSRGWSLRQLARELGIAQSSASRALKLLELPAEIQDRVESGTIPASSAYEMRGLVDPAAQRELADRAAAGELSRDDVIEAARDVAARNRASSSSRKPAGKAANKPPTSRSFRPGDGVSVTIERGRGLTTSVLVKALRAILEPLERELEKEQAA